MARRRLLFLMDFDETLTRAGNDTISILASAAYTLRREAAIPPWSHFVDAYMDDYNAHARKYPPAVRTTLAAETEFLRSLKCVERASVERVEASGVFKGFDLGGLLCTAAATEGVMREGWWGAVRKVVEEGRVAVVSVNWSRSWIRKCLEGDVQDGADEVQKVEVFANELVVDGHGSTTGCLDRWFGQEDGGIWTGWDKLRVMRSIINKSSEQGLVVYVGDSSTDLLCLLEADVGIFFGQKLDGVCERLGVEIKEGLTGEASGRALHRVKEWNEIEKWIDGL